MRRAVRAAAVPAVPGDRMPKSPSDRPETARGFAPARRMQALRPNTLARVVAASDEKRRQGVALIDFGLGNPDLRPAPHVIAAMHAALDDTAQENHRYPGFAGLPEFRRAIAAWYDRRFGVRVDPATEVLPVVGSKE